MAREFLQRPQAASTIGFGGTAPLQTVAFAPDISDTVGKENFKQLLKKIEFPGKVTRAPEQDFLATVDIYTKHWTALPSMYNFQPHQFANTCL